MPLTRLVESQATKTGTYTVTPTDSIVLANGTFTVYLYAASGDIGRVQTIRNIGSGSVTVQANGAELIDGSNTKALAAGEAVRLTCDGTRWWTLSTSSLNANNATYLNGKTEGNLNVNSALTSNNSTYAFGKSEGALNANSANTANAATFLAGNTVTTNSTALYVGANVVVNASALFVGNSTVNVALTSSALFVNGNTGSANQVLTSNGSAIAWANGGTGGGASVTVSANTPASANSGDLWWDSDDGQLRIYYADGTSNAWVDAATSAAVAIAPNTALTIASLYTGQLGGGVQALSTASAQNADVALNANCTILNVTLTGSDGPWITGLAGGVDGRIVAVHNSHATYTLKFASDSANSTAANRIYTPGTELWLGPRRTYIFFYDTAAARWRVLN